MPPKPVDSPPISAQCARTTAKAMSARVKHGCVNDHHIVEMLTGRGLVVVHDHIAREKSRPCRSGRMPSRITTPRSATKCDTPPIFCEISAPVGIE